MGVSHSESALHPACCRVGSSAAHFRPKLFSSSCSNTHAVTAPRHVSVADPSTKPPGIQSNHMQNFNSYPIFSLQFSPLLYLFRHKFIYPLFSGIASKLLFKAPPGFQQHDPLLFLLTVPHGLIGLLIDLPAPRQAALPPCRELELCKADPYLWWEQSNHAETSTPISDS